MPFAPVTLIDYASKCYKNIHRLMHTASFTTVTFDCTEYMIEMSPAACHIDGTARRQIVSAENSPDTYAILRHYHELTGIPSLINTSFHIHEEPIVLSPSDAVQAFKQSRLDYLALDDFLVWPRNHS